MVIKIGSERNKLLRQPGQHAASINTGLTPLPVGWGRSSLIATPEVARGRIRAGTLLQRKGGRKIFILFALVETL